MRKAIASRESARDAGRDPVNLPGRGLSNVWTLTRGGDAYVTSIRTTKDGCIAFPPLESGTKWKTLDDVELVLVASVDRVENPNEVQVYLFDATDVRERFHAAYFARLAAGHTVRDDYGMWVALDTRQTGSATSVGTGLADEHDPIAVFSVASLMQQMGVGKAESQREVDYEHGPIEAADDDLLTIAEAKRRLAKSLGVDPRSIKITVEA